MVFRSNWMLFYLVFSYSNDLISGKALIYGLQSGERTRIDGGDALFKGITIKGFWLMHWVALQERGIQKELIQELFSLIKRGIVKPNVEKTYPLRDFKVDLGIFHDTLVVF